VTDSGRSGSPPPARRKTGPSAKEAVSPPKARDRVWILWCLLVAIVFVAGGIGLLLWVRSNAGAPNLKAAGSEFPTRDIPPSPLPTEQASAGGFDRRRFAVIDLPSDAIDFAIDSASGHIAVAAPYRTDLLVYAASDLSPGRNPSPRRIEIPGAPVSVVFKVLDQDRLFVVGLDNPATLVLMDAATLTIKRRLLLNTPAARWLQTSVSPSDPYVYFCSGRTTPGPIVRYDLKHLAPAGKISIGELTVSADGRTLFPRGDRRDGKRTRAARWPAPENLSDETGAVQLEEIGVRDDSNDTVYSDPSGQFVAVGHSLLDPTLSTVSVVAEFQPQAFLSGTPWMAGMAGTDWMIGSINDGRTQDRVALPESWFATDERPPIPWPTGPDLKPAPIAKMLADPPRDQFLLGTRRQLVAFPLSALRLTAQKRIWVSNELPHEWPAGKPLEVSLALPGNDLEIELAGAPKGMRLVGQTVRWTPLPRDVGDHSVQVNVSSQSVSHSQSWSIRVVRPTINLPFEPSALSIAADGTRALAWHKADPRFGTSAEPRLTVIDLTTDRIVADRTLDEPLVAPAITESDVYVLTRDHLSRLSSNDLKTVKQIEIKNHRATGLTLIADRRIDFTAAEHEYVPPRSFRLPGLDPITTFDHDVVRANDWPSGRCHFGWIDEGILWDTRFDKPLMLLWPVAFRRLGFQAITRIPHARVAKWCCDVPPGTRMRRRIPHQTR
jgi:hypothetical protein